ncbi:protein translocase subunit SecD [Pengzhenrongella sicca]|uniref:Protein translocase subunit SecD n=1 Tax=Pengzhenrongella sicca TaxID=2819238 RepID=A0A8A4ZAI8_9MICO|nr:protein translocase subunit SecD [Pengzhenrongella sicca]QTE28039.1 protein translocase subunit SecD [Pengzhenrongella sicca]
MTLGVLVVALFGSLLAGVQWSDASLSPKLALDLEGGTQLVMTPVPTGDQEITSDTIDEAINIIRQRVDSSGVSEAEITSEGGSNIVVALPGTPDQATLDLVRTSAQMRFRPVLTILDPAVNTEAATPITPKAAPDSPSDADYYITDAVLAEANALDCTDNANLAGGDSGEDDAALVTCDADGTAKYILGPVEIQGDEIASASSGLRTTSTGATTNEWVVNIEFTSAGRPIFRDVTTRLQGLTSPQNQFAMVLDGLVISAPSLDTGVIITDGKAEISGTFTRETAASLANQLNFGALPFTFQVQSEEQISATLGSEQLEKGLLAGLIGLLLVVVYSLFQYRALGFVTVFSLVLAALLTYGVITVLSWTQGYRLSLPGVAALIVAIGITADSFIVYFERVRDELRDGRTLRGAVDKGWERARRTILASDAVNFLAAVVLYFLAVGGVRGFAFTLGLTTIIDLIVVFLFTHPVLTLLARTKFFAEGHRFSGLDPRQLGAPGVRYAGRGRVVARADAGSPVASGSDAPAPAGVQDDAVVAAAVPVGARAATGFGADAPRQTIAERRAAQRAADRAVEADGGSVDSDEAHTHPGDPGDAQPDDADGPAAGAAHTERNDS